MREMKVLFCCMANICRSPMAEGVFRRMVEDAGLADRVLIDSAGTHAEVVDSPPDARAQKVMAERGIDISGLRSRRITRTDFEQFDHILVMDNQNLDSLRFVCPRTQSRKLKLLLDFAPEMKIQDIPDPFRGDESRFERVLELVEAAGRGLLKHVRRSLSS
jgi:protein-tyrosine phosphatase